MPWFHDAAGTEAEAAERPYAEGSRASGAPGALLVKFSEDVGIEGGAGVEGRSVSLSGALESIPCHRKAQLEQLTT